VDPEISPNKAKVQGPRPKVKAVPRRAKKGALPSTMDVDEVALPEGQAEDAAIGEDNREVAKRKSQNEIREKKKQRRIGSTDANSALNHGAPEISPSEKALSRPKRGLQGASGSKAALPRDERPNADDLSASDREYDPKMTQEDYEFLEG
jgi:hypothetical protein